MSLIICKASATLKIYNLIIGVLIKVYFLQMVSMQIKLGQLNQKHKPPLQFHE